MPGTIAGTRNVIHPVTVGILLAALATGAGAEVYRWTDAEGRVHYGDRPSAGSQSVPVGSGAATGQPPTNDAERLQRQQRMLDAYRQEREEKQQAEAKRKADDAERERNCAHGRDVLARYERSSGIYEPQADGTRRYLSEAEKESAIRAAQGDVKRWCGPVPKR
jgi:hypothetical protein